MKIGHYLKLTFILLIVGVLFLIASAFSQVEATHEREAFEVSGTASNYPCTAGWCDGTATVALPLDLGGRYNGSIHGYVEVCATRCATFAVVDYCQCYWGTADQRVVDLSHAAWGIITDRSLSTGLIDVTVRSADGSEVYDGDSVGGSSEPVLPNTAVPSGR